MGHRAWLTPVNNEIDFKLVIDTAENGEHPERGNRLDIDKKKVIYNF